jgi:hypothetical protein
MNVSGRGMVSISTNVAFSGTVMICGETVATVANMVNLIGVEKFM